MKIALNGATTMHADLETDIRAAGAAGFDLVELWASKLRTYLETHTAADLRALLTENNVEPYSINSIEHITFRTPEDYASVKAQCAELSEIAGGINCPYIVVVPGKLPNDATKEQIIDESVRVLNELADISEPHGVSLAFEFLGQTDCSVQTLDLCNEIVEVVDRKSIGNVIDTFHFYAGNSTFEAIDSMKPEKLFIFHINDAEDLPKEQLTDAQRLYPGTGILPIAEIKEHFDKIGYDRMVSIEIFRPEYWDQDPFEVAKKSQSRDGESFGTRSECAIHRVVFLPPRGPANSELRAEARVELRDKSRTLNLMNKIKIGIIGTGYIGNVHGRIYSRDPRTEVAALYDVIPERAEATSKTIGGKVCTSREELLENCDAVLVTAPNKTHKEIALHAIAEQKHIFCEKPFSIGIADATELRDAANKSGCVFQVGHNRRYAPVYVQLKHLLQSDKAHSAHIKMNRGELVNPIWTGDVNVTGGFLYETTIHLFDMMRFQFGEIEELVAYGSQHEYPELDEFSIIFKFKNGFHCTFASSSDASWHFPFERIEVFCHHRTIMTQEMETLLDSRGMDANFETHSWHMTEKEEKWGYVQEDRAFIDSILEGIAPPVTADDGFKSVELVESVYEAIRSGERIRFA